MPEDNNQYSPYTPPQPSPTPPSQPQPQAQPYQPQPQPVAQYPVETQELASVEQEAPTQSQQFFASPTANEQPMTGTFAPIAESPAQLKTPNKKKKLIIGGIIAGAVLLLGGGTYTAYALWYQNPEKVLTDAVTNAIKAKTATYQGAIIADSSDVKIKVELDGVEAGLSSRETNAKITITAQGKDFKLNGSGLADKDGNVFFKVSNLKAVIDQTLGATGMTSAFDGLIEKIDNKWIRISADDLAEFSKEASDTKKCASDVLKKLDTDKPTRDEFASIYGKNKFIVVDSDLPARTIAGVDSMGYKLSIDRAVAKSFVEAINKTQLVKDLQKCDDSFKLDAESITEEPDNGVTTTVEVSVSRWSHEFTQLKFDAKNKSGSASATIEPLFNKDVKVVAPTDFLTLKQLQAEIESAMTAIQETAYSGIQDRGEAAAAQANANYVIKKAETYNAVESKYPTLAELKGGAVTEAELSAEVASLLTSAPLSEDNPTLIRYETCSNTGGHVSYVDVTTGSIVKLMFGVCDSSLL